MIPLDDPTAGWSAPVLAERKVETRLAESATAASKRIGPAWRSGDLPTGHGRARHRRGLMADQQAETGIARACAFARGKREAAGGRKVRFDAIASEFGHDAGERAAAQSLLHRPQHINGARHAQHEKPRRSKAKQIKTGTIGTAALVHGEIGGDPQHLAARSLRTCGQRQRKAARRRKMNRRGWRNLVQRAARKTAAESLIDRNS